MKKNMGIIDKAIRLLIALIIVILYFTNVIDGWLALLLGIITLVFIVTSLISICPLYNLFGFNTCSIKEIKK